MIRHICFLFVGLPVFLFATGLAVGQDKPTVPDDETLNTLRKELRQQDSFPTKTTHRLTQLVDALQLADGASEQASPGLIYAAMIESLELSDEAAEWNLSRDIFRTIQDQYQVDETALGKWYYGALRKCKTNVALAELVELLHLESQTGELPGDLERWNRLFGQFERRVKKTTSDASRAWMLPKLETIKARIKLQSADSDAWWDGLRAVLFSGELDAALTTWAGSGDKTLSQIATKIQKDDAAFEDRMALLNLLMKDGEVNGRDVARAFFRDMIEKLTDDEIRLAQSVCFPIDHSLEPGFWVTCPVSETGGRLKPAKLTGRSSLGFDQNENCWVIAGPFTIDYAPAPLINFVHEIEFSADVIQGHLKFRFGKYNSLRVQFETNEDKKSIHLRHQSSFGHRPKSKYGKDRLEFGKRHQVTLYNFGGQQFAFLNGKYATQRGIGTDWATHQMISHGDDNQVKIYKSTIRPWLDGDLALFKRASNAGDRERTIGQRQVSWKRSELERFVRENGKLEKKLEPGKPFVNQAEIVMQPISAGSYKLDKTTVEISHDFWVSRHEISQAQYEQVMASAPGSMQGNPYFPVDNVSYKDASRFCRNLNHQIRRDRTIPKGYQYRLLTDREWEYVARGGKDEDPAVPPGEFWHHGTSALRQHAIGSSEPNAWGVFDMHGNLEEFVIDQFVNRPNDQPASKVVDEVNFPTSNDVQMVIRGGSWQVPPGDCHHGRRKQGTTDATPCRGFRIALAPALGK